KGLVQLQYELSDGSAIRLTTARYYTPLGRSIQRAYDKGKKVYMDEIWERYSNGEVLYADSNKVSNGKQYVTPAGDTLYGGGGIMPDIFVPIDTTTYPVVVNRLLSSGQVNNYVYRYYLQNRASIDHLKGPSDFSVQYATGEKLLEGLQREMGDTIPIRQLDTASKSFVERQLAAYLARFRWHNNGYFQIRN